MNAYATLAKGKSLVKEGNGLIKQAKPKVIWDKIREEQIGKQYLNIIISITEWDKSRTLDSKIVWSNPENNRTSDFTQSTYEKKFSELKTAALNK